MVQVSFPKKIRSFITTKHLFHRAADETPKQKTSRFLHFSKLEKTILAVAITAILLVSALGLIMDAQQKQTPPVSDPTTNPTSNPTDNPSATATQGPPNSVVTQAPQPSSDSNVRPPWSPVITQPNPTKAPGLVESDPNMTSATWTSIAQNAWNYFAYGSGVDPGTGLPASSHGWNHFTDWDLGVYIQAIIDAQKISLITKDDAHTRLDKVITFLETRPLEPGTNGVPYWFYSSDGTGWQNQTSTDVADSGTLLAALYNAKTFDNSFATRIDNFVYNRVNSTAPHNSNSRTNYESIVPGLQAESSGSTSIYAYYASVGFAEFFPQLQGAPNTILNNIKNAGTVTTYNVTLPKAKILCEPLLYSVFNLRGNPIFNPYLVTLMNQTYSAHEAEYNATGRYIAFSEGIGPTDFIWEWVVQPNGDVWKISNPDGSYADINPVVYTKVSLSFLSLYDTPFAYNMSVYLEKVSGDPSGGYCAGADYNSDINLAKVYGSVDSNTNGLILSAARYALGA